MKRVLIVAAGILWLSTVNVSAEPCNCFGLRTLDGPNGYCFGRDVAVIGDVDSDFVPDFIVSSNEVCGNSAAAVYSGASGDVIYGPYYCTAHDSVMGLSVAGAGDVDNDGIPDFMIGLPEYPEGSIVANSGAVCVFSGSTGEMIGDTIFSPYSWLRGQFGFSLASAGDWDGDGQGGDYIVIGAPYPCRKDGTLTKCDQPGRVFVFHYNAGSGTWENDLNISGHIRQEYFGWSVDGGADFDSLPGKDIIVGEPRHDRGNNVDIGKIYLYSGATGNLIDTLAGFFDNEYVGRRVAWINDLDQNGYDDVLYTKTIQSTGVMTILACSGNNLSANLVAIQCNPNEQTGVPNWEKGADIAAAGDIDNDGVSDILIGMPGNDSSSGQAIIYSGVPGFPDHPALLRSIIRAESSFGLSVAASINTQPGSGFVLAGSPDYNTVYVYGCGVDSDSDSVLDDGDISGVAGDNRCGEGESVNCDDNCISAYNPGQDDEDGDRVGDDCDNCISDFNPLQADVNHNGEGNVCDGCWVCGDFDGDSLVNVADPIKAIDYIFGGGPPPEPLASGDVNHSGSVNVDDAVYLVNFIFKGGPPPDCLETPTCY